MLKPRRADPRMCARSDAPDGCEQELGVTDNRLYGVSAGGHGLVNERVSFHRVVLDVFRDAQILASQSHKSVQTLVCVIGSDEQRVTDTSSE